MGVVLRKAAKALRRPAHLASKLRKPHIVIRNVVYGFFNYWPVTPIENEEVRRLPYFCISLPQAARRRELMQRQAEQLGLRNFRIVDAVEAAKLDVDALIREGIYDDEETRRLHGKPLTRAEIACSLSHGRVYEQIVAEQLQSAVVLEDDALFISRNLDALRPSGLPADYDVVFLNSFLTEDPPQGGIKGTLYSDASYRGSSAAYLLSAQGAKKLASIYKPLIHDADGLLGRQMPAPPNGQHPFKQKGARTVTQSYIIYPHCAVNGSTAFFTLSSLG